jgi:hypothetical protein
MTNESLRKTASTTRIGLWFLVMVYEETLWLCYGGDFWSALFWIAFIGDIFVLVEVMVRLDRRRIVPRFSSKFQNSFPRFSWAAVLVVALSEAIERIGMGTRPFVQ